MNHSEKMRKEIIERLFMAESLLMSASLKPPKDTPRMNLPKYGASVHFMQALVLELIIKMNYVLNHQQSPRFTHDIYKLFNTFSKDIKEFLDETYDEARKRQQDFWKNIKDIKSEDRPTFPPFIKILEQNEYIVKDFKYTANLSGAKNNFAMDSLFYKKVFKYIKEELEKIFPEK